MRQRYEYRQIAGHGTSGSSRRDRRPNSLDVVQMFSQNLVVGGSLRWKELEYVGAGYASVAILAALRVVRESRGGTKVDGCLTRPGAQ